MIESQGTPRVPAVELVEALEDAHGELANADHPHNYDASFNSVAEANAKIEKARAALLSRLSSLEAALVEARDRLMDIAKDDGIKSHYVLAQINQAIGSGFSGPTAKGEIA